MIPVPAIQEEPTTRMRLEKLLAQFQSEQPMIFRRCIFVAMPTERTESHNTIYVTDCHHNKELAGILRTIANTLDPQN